MPKWNGKWDGGRTYEGREGQTVWVIDKYVHGKSRSITLDARNPDEALAELALFNRDREKYLTKVQAQAKEVEEEAREKLAGVYLDGPTIQRFLNHLAGKDAKGNIRKDLQPRTARYRQNLLNYLTQWATKLEGVDLRYLKTKDLKKMLGSWSKARKSRIIAFKSFCSFLVDEGDLEPSENASLGLKVPPSKRSEVDKYYEPEFVARHYAAMNAWKPKVQPAPSVDPASIQAARDVVMLHAKAGMHYTEIERMALGQREVRLVDHPEIRGVIEFKHKNGDPHVQALDAQALAAAQRLQKRGSAPAESWVRKVLHKAAKALGEPERLRLGYLRSSHITWALNAGELITISGKGIPLATIATLVGHKTPTTTRRFYDRTKVPPMAKLPLNLHHPDDPPLVTLKLVANS